MQNRNLIIKRVVIGVYITLGAFLLAHTVNAFVEEALRVPALQPSPPLASITPSEPEAESPPQPETKSPRALADAIMTSGLFPLPPVATKTEQASEVPPAPLNVAKRVALLGTVFGQQGGIMAILEELETKKQGLYHMGEKIAAVGTLSAIEKHRVLFREGKQEEWLDLALLQDARTSTPGTAIPAAVSRPSTPQRHVLDRREIDAALADPTRLLTQAQAVPHLTNGKLDGFRLYTVMPQGFFEKIGLQTNDLLQRINGVELRDPSTLFSLFQQLRNERTIRVDLVRNAQQQTLSYEIR